MQFGLMATLLQQQIAELLGKAPSHVRRQRRQV
jgi:hypothetical protein